MSNSTDKAIQIRSFLLNNVDTILESLTARKEYQKNASEDIFGVEEVPSGIKWKKQIQPRSKFEILQLEKYSLGVYMSGDPLQEFKPILEYFRKATKENNTLFICILDKFKKIFTKSGGMMLALQIIVEDGKEFEALIFPKYAMNYSPILAEKELYWMLGRIDDKSKKKELETKDNDSEASESEPEEYQSKPKILVSHLVKFETGVKELLKTDNRERKVELIESIPNPNWAKIQENPGNFEQLIELVTQSKVYKNIDLSIAPEVEKVEIKRIMSSSEVTQIKAKLKKEPFSGSHQVEVWVEDSTGELRRAKGNFWM